MEIIPITLRMIFSYFWESFNSPYYNVLFNAYANSKSNYFDICKFKF